jgi:hypothetical protein
MYQFQIRAHTQVGETIGLVGSGNELGVPTSILYGFQLRRLPLIMNWNLSQEKLYISTSC